MSIVKRFLDSIRKTIISARFRKDPKKKSKKRAKRKISKTKKPRSGVRLKNKVGRTKSRGAKRKAARTKKKAAPQKKAAKAAPKEAPGVFIGEITHYFSKIGVCVIKITNDALRIGDRLALKGHTTNFVQQVRSLQIENNDVAIAGKGHLVGLKIDKRARAGDKVYKIR